MRQKNKDRPIKCVFCEHRPLDPSGKLGDDCPQCGKPESMIWNWLPKAKPRELSNDEL